MKKILLSVVICFWFIVCKSQNWQYQSPGFQSSGIFDTVKAIILIDNEKLQKTERIQGYAIREWNTWYGGIAPYIVPGYHPSPNQWFPTGVYLYHNKKVIKATIWNEKIIADCFKPMPKIKVKDKENQLSISSDSIYPPPNFICTGINDSLSVYGTGTTHLTIDVSNMDHVLTFNSTGPSWKTLEHIDTIFSTLYVDKSLAGSKKVRFEKVNGFEVRHTFPDKDMESIYLDFKKKVLSPQVIKAIPMKKCVVFDGTCEDYILYENDLYRH